MTPITTTSYRIDVSQLLGNSMFASAGEGIWDNGAACGRQYVMRCISATEPKTCVTGRTIQIRFVDRVLTSVSRPTKPGVTMVLSKAALQPLPIPHLHPSTLNFNSKASLLIVLISFPRQYLISADEL